ncbi:MAG: cytochrome c peroxidase [Bacteroidota bacterium]
MNRLLNYVFFSVSLIFISCGTNNETVEPVDLTPTSISNTFGGSIDFNNLYNYSAQSIPDYIDSDNTGANTITDEGATLGRVLFYDVNLSIDNTISCASCHKQENAFGDTDLVSQGVNGFTGRHSMRLVNTRFSEERRFFWDERANSLEDQTTQPIRDHIEMGFSGSNGDPGFEDLIVKLENLQYYSGLFTIAFGDSDITEERMQQALGQFIRSIQSFDSRYDQGLSISNNLNNDFSNFGELENLGKELFMAPPGRGGAGCNACHSAPGFSIDPDSRNNGIVSVAGDPLALDLTVTRAPSLRDIFNAEGDLNGSLMHDGSLSTMLEVMDHYNEIDVDPSNNNLDNRLRGPGNMGQNLNLTETEKEAIVAFIKTLSGSNIYSDEKWSDPFTNQN